MQYTIGKYGVLFSVLIKHSYFRDELCPYLDVEPDMPTISLLRNRHMISKNFPGEIKVLAAVPDNRTNIKTPAKDASAENQHYTFLLRAKDTAFYSVTKLDLTGFPKQVFYFSNTAKSTKLSVQKCFVADGIITMTYEEGKAPSKIKILGRNKAEIYTGEVNKTTGAFVHDMAAHPAGLYSVVSTFAKGDQQKPQTQVIYYHPLIKKEPVLGVIDIDATEMNSVEQENKTSYIVRFEPIAGST